MLISKSLLSRVSQVRILPWIPSGGPRSSVEEHRKFSLATKFRTDAYFLMIFQLAVVGSSPTIPIRDVAQAEELQLSI